MGKVEYVELTLKTGVVHLQNHDGSEIDASYPLWDGMTAKEFYPAVTQGGAYYVITLGKGIAKATEVSATEAELSGALRKIASAWVFAGGSQMVVEHRDIISSKGFTSNAESVRERLLAAVGQKELSASFSMPMGFGATYSQAPLALAVDIAVVMEADFFVNRLINYYQQASLERSLASWALHLYKVRDLLDKRYCKPKKAYQELGISYKREWSRFGELLNNNDLRHAEICGTVPIISRNDIDWLFRTSRSWIAKFLRTKGVNAIG
jgi:hypothetical protein